MAIAYGKGGHVLVTMYLDHSQWHGTTDLEAKINSIHLLKIMTDPSAKFLTLPSIRGQKQKLLFQEILIYHAR